MTLLKRQTILRLVEENKTGGLWDMAEQDFHINYLEMKAVFLELKSLCYNIRQNNSCIY
jgi:hypothetical protein